MFCEKCGAKLEDQAAFCGFCGSKVMIPQPAQMPEPEPEITFEPEIIPEAEDLPEMEVAAEVEAAPEAEAISGENEIPEEAAPEEEEVPEEADPEEEEISEEAAPEEEEIPEEADSEEEEIPAEEAFAEAEAAPEAVIPEAQADPQPEVLPEVEIPPEIAQVNILPEQTPAVAPEPAPAKQPPKEKKPKQKKPAKSHKPHIVLRILMQFMSFVLCITLLAAMLATVVIADLNHVLSPEGVKKLINAVLIPSSAAPRVTPVVGAVGVNMADAPGFTIPGNLDLSDIPEDLLTGDPEDTLSGLIDWVYEKVEESSEQPLTVTKEQVQTFVEESTISDYAADKLAGFANDFINGTETTVITTEEIMDLVEENAKLIEKTFDTEMTPQLKQQISQSVDKAVVENDLNTVIREQVFETVKDTINKSTEAAIGMDWEEIQPIVQLLCSDLMLYTAIGVCLILMILICLLNFYNIPGGLTWIAVPAMFGGLVLTAPVIILQAAPDLVSSFLPTEVASLLGSFAGVMLPYHAGLLGFGCALLLIAIVWRIIRSAVRRKRNPIAA